MTSHTSKDDALRGILFMAANAFCFAVITAIVKLLGSQFHLVQIIFFRCVFSMVPMVFLVRRQYGSWGLPPTKRFWGHALRTVIGLAAMFGLFYAFIALPLADALALTSSGPLFAALFAILLLGESAGWRRWLAMAAGFSGVIVMAQPSGQVTWTGIAIALTGAMFQGLAMTSVRSLGKTEEPLTTVYYFSLLSIALTLAPLPFVWETPSLSDWLVLFIIGVLSFATQFFLTKAYYYAPAAVVTPLNYTTIVWGAAFGYFFWGEAPTPHVILGAGIVMAAAAFIAWRETRKHRTPTAAEPAN